MKKPVFIILLLVLVISGYAQKVDCSDKPTWQDEFNSRGIPSKYKWITNEAYQLAIQSDSRFSFRQKGGKLNITLISQGKPTVNFLSNIYSTYKNRMKYGKIEVRAKVPIAKGIWPGIWLRPTRGLKVDVSGEIDLMEWISCFDKHRFQSTFHLWGNFNGKKNNHTQYAKAYKNKGFDITKYHIYSAEWDSEKIIIRVDKHLVGIWYAKDYPLWPFDYTYELVLDVGYGDWGASCGYDLSKLPQTMKIDWVRYYKLK